MSRKAARERRDRTRGGDHDAKGEGSERRCISTGKTLPKEELIRFVAGPDGEVVPDLGNDLPGRGAWVKAERSAIDRAIVRIRLCPPFDTRKPSTTQGGRCETGFLAPVSRGCGLPRSSTQRSAEYQTMPSRTKTASRRSALSAARSRRWPAS